MFRHSVEQMFHRVRYVWKAKLFMGQFVCGGLGQVVRVTPLFLCALKLPFGDNLFADTNPLKSDVALGQKQMQA